MIIVIGLGEADVCSNELFESDERVPRGTGGRLEAEEKLVQQ